MDHQAVLGHTKRIVESVWEPRYPWQSTCLFVSPQSGGGGTVTLLWFDSGSKDIRVETNFPFCPAERGMFLFITRGRSPSPLSHSFFAQEIIFGICILG